MPTKILVRYLPIALTLLFSAQWALDGGDLDPPSGPIASTGRFGSRIDALSLPGDSIAMHIISVPGSYYLSGNLIGTTGKSGIAIRSKNVTLDLGGFALLGVPGSASGVQADALDIPGIVVRNGQVEGWGDQGVYLGGSPYRRVENVLSRNNGSYGIQITGEQAHIVRDCQAIDNGTVAVSGGIFVSEFSLVSECAAFSNTGTGILLPSPSSLANSLSTQNSVVDIEMLDGLLRGCAFGGLLTTSATLVDNQ